MNVQSGVPVHTNFKETRGVTDENYCLGLYETGLVADFAQVNHDGGATRHIMGTTGSTVSAAAELLRTSGTVIIQRVGIGIEQGKLVRIEQLVTWVRGFAYRNNYQTVEVSAKGEAFDICQSLGFRPVYVAAAEYQKMRLEL